MQLKTHLLRIREAILDKPLLYFVSITIIAMVAIVTSAAVGKWLIFEATILVYLLLAWIGYIGYYLRQKGVI